MYSKVGGKKHNVSKCVCVSTFLHICVQIYGFVFVCMCMFACMMCAYWHKSTSALCGIVNASKQSLSVLPLHAGGLRVVLWRTAQWGSMETFAGKELKTNLLLDRKETYSKGKPREKNDSCRKASSRISSRRRSSSWASSNCCRCCSFSESHQRSKLEYKYFQSPFPDHERKSRR